MCLDGAGRRATRARGVKDAYEMRRKYNEFCEVFSRCVSYRPMGYICGRWTTVSRRHSHVLSTSIDSACGLWHQTSVPIGESYVRSDIRESTYEYHSLYADIGLPWSTATTHVAARLTVRTRDSVHAVQSSSRHRNLAAQDAAVFSDWTRRTYANTATSRRT